LIAVICAMLRTPALSPSSKIIRAIPGKRRRVLLKREISEGVRCLAVI
jgi:hypothetical protein